MSETTNDKAAAAAKATTGWPDLVFTLAIAALLCLQLYLGFDPAGLRDFGAKAQILCRVSAGLLLPLLAVRLWGHWRGRRSAYLGPGLALLLLPFAALPLYSGGDGGLGLAAAKGLSPRLAAAAADPAPAPVNPFTGQALAPPAGKAGSGPAAQAGPGGALRLDAANFQATVRELYARPDAHRGQGIELEGICYAGPEGLVAGRLMIYCCPADGTLVGLGLRLPAGGGGADPTVLGDGAHWWRIRGTLAVESAEARTDANGRYSAGGRFPVIELNEAVPAVLPDDPFIYP